MTFMDPTRRVDLPVELDVMLDGSGNHTGDWVESADVYAVRVSCTLNSGGSPVVTLEEGIFTPNQADPKVVREQSVPMSGSKGYAALDLSARYFRLVVTGGPASTLLRASIRSV